MGVYCSELIAAQPVENARCYDSSRLSMTARVEPQRAMRHSRDRFSPPVAEPEESLAFKAEIKRDFIRRAESATAQSRQHVPPASYIKRHALPPRPPSPQRIANPRTMAVQAVPRIPLLTGNPNLVALVCVSTHLLFAPSLAVAFPPALGPAASGEEAISHGWINKQVKPSGYTHLANRSVALAISAERFVLQTVLFPFSPPHLSSTGSGSQPEPIYGRDPEGSILEALAARLAPKVATQTCLCLA
ncbi:uncharacterized protein VTP21DRAFT_2189 [Calcarisporiella thermophila]|uniref:uncharacterized protein n=1 Tax=Calcarisporiella thermophila TaxID=911321 RepID=UPI0037436483